MGVPDASFLLYFPLQSQKQNVDINRQAKFAATPSLALFVNLKNVVCKIGEDAEVLMSLYDPVESKFIRSVMFPSCCLFTLVGVGAPASEPSQSVTPTESLGAGGFPGQIPPTQLSCQDGVVAGSSGSGQGQLSRVPGNLIGEF